MDIFSTLLKLDDENEIATSFNKVIAIKQC